MSDWEDAPSADGWESAPGAASAEESSLVQFGKNFVGGNDAVASMIMSLPGYVGSGLAGLGTLAVTGDAKKADDVRQMVQEKGTIQPFTQAGKEVTEMLSHGTEAAKSKVGNLGGDSAAGRSALEFGTEMALNLLPIPGVKGARKVGNYFEGKPKPKSSVEIAKEKQAKIDAAKWEDAPEGSARNGVDIRTDLPEVMPVTREGQGIVNPADAMYREEALRRQRAEQVRNMTNEEAQRPLFDQPEEGRPPMANEAVTGDWRIDENGIPVKADLSMEAANLENPLQRNLFGDELARKHEQEGIGITEAMDNTKRDAMMAEDLATADMRLQEMQKQMDILMHDLKSDPHMERALMDADIRSNTPRSADPAINSLRRTSPGGRQTGGINKDLLNFGFFKKKELPNGFTMHLRGGERGPSIDMYDERGVHVANLDASPMWDHHTGNERNMETRFVKVSPEHQGKGLAKEMYQFLSENGNDIQRSSELLPDGKRMWEGFSKSGFAQGDKIPAKRYIPMGQRGAVGNLRPGKKSRTIVDDLKKRFEREDKMIPKDPDPKAIVEAAKAEGKDGRGFNNLESGASLTAEKRKSALIRGAEEINQNHSKMADANIRDNVFPVEENVRKLSRAQVIDLAEILKEESKSGKRFSPEALDHLTPHQLAAYSHLRHAFEDTLARQNAIREMHGQKPITELEHYLSSRWQGDFRRPIFQAVLDEQGNPKIKADGSLEKKLVYYLAGETKWDLNKQTEALKKERPDLDYSHKVEVVKNYRRQTDLQSSLTSILDIIGRDEKLHPLMQEVVDIVQKQQVNEAATFLGQEKHFKEKAGVRGFVGDRPGRKPFPESLDMFQQQIQYLKNAYNWTEKQLAAEKIKELVTDKELIEQQPNNVKYVKDYYKNSIGFGEHVAVAHIEDWMRDSFGTSSGLIDRKVGSVKAYFILQKLLANTGYMIAQGLQTANILPHMLSEWHYDKYNPRNNPITGVAAGLAAGTLVASKHYLNQLKLGKSTTLIPSLGKDAFVNRAFKYAEDNGVTGRSLMDETAIDSAFKPHARIANAAGKLTMSAPETFTRSLAFMAFATQLKGSKRFKSDMEVFQQAERKVNMALGDYRAEERPMIFNKMGSFGNALNVLQTYPFNFYNQTSFMAREALRGNVAPFMAFVALQYQLAGIMGVPYADDIFKLYDLVKDKLVPTKTYQKMQESEVLSNPKLAAAKHFGHASVYGALSDELGIGMTSRLSSPGVTQMAASPGGAFLDVGEQAYLAGKAAIGPMFSGNAPFSNTTDNAQAAMKIAPTGLQGLLETSPVMKDKMWVEGPDGKRVYQRPGDIESHTGIVRRDDHEESLRKWGLRSNAETIERDLGYRVSNDTRVAEKRARDLPEAIYDAAKRNKTEEVQSLYEAYVKLTGNEISQEAWDNMVTREYTTSVERASSAAQTVTALQNVARMKAVLKEVRDEYQRKRNRGN